MRLNTSQEVCVWTRGLLELNLKLPVNSLGLTTCDVAR